VTSSSPSWSELVEDLRELAVRRGWQFRVSYVEAAEQPFADADLQQLSQGPLDRTTRASRSRIRSDDWAADDEVLVDLRCAARRQQEKAIALSRQAEVAPHDSAARSRAGQAWKDSEARWQAVDAYQAALISAPRTPSSAY